jgi:hypothetical protein
VTAKVPPLLPRRIWRYPVAGGLLEQLRGLSPRQRWIAEQSTLRWERRHNAGHKLELLPMEVGTWQGIRIIESRLPPSP